MRLSESRQDAGTPRETSALRPRPALHRIVALFLLLGGLGFCGGFDLFRRQLEDLLAHFLAGLELDDRSLRDGNVGLRGVGIPAHARFPNLYFEDAEVAQLNFPALGEGARDVIQRFLDDIKDLLLDKARFVADADDKVTLGHIWSGSVILSNFLRRRCFLYG